MFSLPVEGLARTSSRSRRAATLHAFSFAYSLVRSVRGLITGAGVSACPFLPLFQCEALTKRRMSHRAAFLHEQM